ncbi:MAG: hypothetical protein IKT46_01365 [Clostridia bacterium]|nr:hypothetical protein [Clostridia bacterium]
MKRIIFLLIIFGCLLFCGCAATADMEYGIDADNNAYTRLRVDIKTTDNDEKDSLEYPLQQLGEYYRDELGFEYEYDIFTEDPDNAYILLTRSVPADSFEQAFENLKEMLCDESLTAFSELSCELSDTDPQYAYRIKGRVDLNKVFENIYSSGISKGTADLIASMVDNCSFSVTLSLPQNTHIYRLSHTEPTEIYHEGEVFTVLGNQLSPAATSVAESGIKIALWVSAALSVLMLTGMTVGVICIKKGKGTAKGLSPTSSTQEIPQNGEEVNDREKDNNPL